MYKRQAPDNIYYFGSPVTYVSQEQTNEAKELVASEVGQVYTRDNLVVVDLHKQVDETFSNLYLIKSNVDLTEEEQIDQIREILGENVSEDAILYYLSASDLNVSKLITTIKEAIANAYSGDVLEEDLTDAINHTKEEIEMCIRDRFYVIFTGNEMNVILF